MEAKTPIRRRRTYWWQDTLKWIVRFETDPVKAAEAQKALDAVWLEIGRRVVREMRLGTKATPQEGN